MLKFKIALKIKSDKYSENNIKEIKHFMSLIQGEDSFDIKY